MGLDGLNHVGRYNRALLAHAADLHVAALTEALQAPKPRPDFWEMAACPRGDVPPAWREFLRDALFPGGSLDVWIEFAARFFTNPHPRDTYERFWQESKRWLDGVARYSRQSQAWRKAARKLCDALAEQAVPVLPVQTADGLRPVSLPTRQKRGDRAARRVFFWPESRDDAPPAVPRALLVRGRSVTTFPLGDCEDASGVARYDATQVLLDLRQIPNDPTSQDTETSLTETQQGELLRLAAELRPSNEVAHFAWRAFEASEPTQRMGRAVATMYLPTIDGTWEPARQLSSDRVDSTRLAALAGEAAATQAFLRWLGVAPNGGVPLLERGDDGVLPPCSLPPDLQAPGTDRDLTLRPRMQPAPSLAAVAASIERLPDDLDRRSAVLHSLGTTAWLSRPLFLPQSDLSALPEHVAPCAVVLTPPGRDNRTVFFAVPKDEGHAPLLRRLGALDRPDSRESAHRTPDTLRWLRQRCPAPQLLSASLARRLAGLCDSLLDLLPHEGEDAVPVLLEAGGGFRWRFDSEPAWLSTARERQEIRRFFPHVPLVVGTGGARLAERLNVGVVRLHSEVRGEPIGAPESRASRLVDRIRPLLPVLCAVAELSRQVQVDPGRILRCWWSGQPLLHVDDAWVLVRLTGPDEEPYRWRVGALDDVFYVGGPDKDEAQPIHFDCRGSGTPPLRHFGRALARQLVRNAALGPAFAEALSAAEDGGVDEFIERAHLRDLVLAWTARLRPLSKDDQDRLVAHLGRWSTDPKGVLSRGRLGSADLRPTLDVATASELSEGLHAVEGAGLAEHLPRVVVPAENEETWVEWMRRWRGTLLAWTAHQGIEAKDLEGELKRGNPTEFDRLDFDPLRRAYAALAFLGVDCDDLHSALDGFRPRFQAVAAAPISLEEAGWRPFEGTVAGGTGGPERKLTTQDILDEQAARTAWGDAAERALLTWVVERTRPLLERADAKEALLSAFRPTSRTRAQVAAAIEAGDVEAALHIAQHWSGAGFDILGLEQHGGSLQPVRYECKGLPRDARRIRIHLSRRELSVARQPTGGGRWMLVGVQPDGAPVDLTALVEPLLADDPRPLAPLHAMGMEPDGYRLLVERAEG